MGHPARLFVRPLRCEKVMLPPVHLAFPRLADQPKILRHLTHLFPSEPLGFAPALCPSPQGVAYHGREILQGGRLGGNPPDAGGLQFFGRRRLKASRIERHRKTAADAPEPLGEFQSRDAGHAVVKEGKVEEIGFIRKCSQRLETFRLALDAIPQAFEHDSRRADRIRVVFYKQNVFSVW